MPRDYKMKYRKWKKRARGKYSLRRKAKFAAKVKKVMMKVAETKFYSVGVENQFLYHNLGWGTNSIPPVTYSSIPLLFNPWRYIPKGTGRSERIGDKISPRGMSLRIWLNNEYPRHGTLYRVIVAVLPRNVGSTITSSLFDPFQAIDQGTNNNSLCRVADADRGVKFLYDKVIRVNDVTSYNIIGDSTKDSSKFVKLWIKRKRSRDIVFNDNQLEIVNKPLAVYILPYEQYSTLQTSRVGGCAIHMKMYYKDI